MSKKPSVHFELAVIPMRLTRVYPGISGLFRDEFNAFKRDEFAAEAVRRFRTQMRTNPQAAKGFAKFSGVGRRKLSTLTDHTVPIHHVIPLSLGGNNEFGNLCLIDPDLHTKIHRYIDSYAKDMIPGEERVIPIPIIRSALGISYVWRMPKKTVIPRLDSLPDITPRSLQLQLKAAANMAPAPGGNRTKAA